jgi:NADH-quinone oxidoreductase subunit E
MPVMGVHEVFTFYNMFNVKPVGRFKINVCTNLPCQLRAGHQTLQYVCKKLGVDVGGTTADGLFTVQPGECMGACADAPVLLVNDRHMCSFMSTDKIDQMIDELRASKVPA